VLLRAEGQLPGRPSRVLVAGTSGAGKSTLAARVAGVLGLPYVEIDALFHGPGWVPRVTFQEEVKAVAASPGWVTEWQYEAVRPLLLARAELLVWLDLSRTVVVRQVGARTVRRWVRREVLWNGNLEPPLHTVLTDPGHVVRWAWSTHHETTRRVAGVLERRPELVVVRRRNRRDVDRWVDGPLRGAAEDPAPAG